MTDTNPAELVKRLRAIGSGDSYAAIPADHRADFHEAADMIESLSAERDAANQRHAAALEAVNRARDAALVEAARVFANAAFYAGQVEKAWVRSAIDQIAALRTQPSGTKPAENTTQTPLCKSDVQQEPHQ